MKNLFIDSNIWLSLYHFSNDDLTQFSKLKELLNKDIKLYVPQQVIDEVNRNREVKLKDAFKSFEFKQIQFPVFCKEYSEYNQFASDYNELLKRYKKWKKQIDEDVLNQCLPADKLVKEFFELTGTIVCDDFVESAVLRYKRGNPPGKDNKYGDAINWECLLQLVPNGEDLYLISTDKDYCSDLFDNQLNPFLLNEWEVRKNSNIYFYKNLIPFLNEHVKDIQLKTEQEKQDLIERLLCSRHFEVTHGIIAMMNYHTGWTEEQIENICMAAENNSQVRWILYDDDVLSFYGKLLDNIDFETLSDSATKRVMQLIFPQFNLDNAN